MSELKTVLIIDAGYPVLKLDGAVGVFVDDTEIVFVGKTPDEVAEALATSDRADLMPLLAHRDGDVQVAYTPQGRRVETEIEDAAELPLFDQALEQFNAQRVADAFHPVPFDVDPRTIDLGDIDSFTPPTAIFSDTVGEDLKREYRELFSEPDASARLVNISPEGFPNLLIDEDESAFEGDENAVNAQSEEINSVASDNEVITNDNISNRTQNSLSSEIDSTKASLDGAEEEENPEEESAAELTEESESVEQVEEENKPPIEEELPSNDPPVENPPITSHQPPPVETVITTATEKPKSRRKTQKPAQE